MSEGGAAIAALTERIKGETKKYWLIKALQFDISINRADYRNLVNSQIRLNQAG
jgi:hypothetical protein